MIEKYLKKNDMLNEQQKTAMAECLDELSKIKAQLLNNVAMISTQLAKNEQTHADRDWETYRFS